jgi:integration host factor subunit alpha
VSYSSLGTSSQTWAAGVSGGLSLYDAQLNQKIVMNNVTEKREDARSLTRAALQGAISASRPSLSRAEARKMLEHFFEEVSDTLARGEPVKLRSFGNFSVRSKRERVGRNPKTGAEAMVTARKVLAFKASPVLVARINGETINDGEE